VKESSVYLTLVVTLAALGGAACSKDEPGPGNGDAAVVDPAAVIGGFDVRLVAPTPATASTPAIPGQAEFAGGVRSGPTPAPTAWRQLMEAGGCKLRKPEPAFCDPGCLQGAVCSAGKCLAPPVPRSAGTVRLRGVGTEGGMTEFTLEPQTPNLIYFLPASVTLKYPPVAPGATVEVSGGGDVGAFTLTAKGVTPLVVMGDEPARIESGQALPLRWTAPTAGESTRIEVLLNVSLHGGTKGKVECDVADSGTLDIPAALVTGLLQLGTAGFPSVILTRRSSGSAAVAAGRLQLSVFGEVTRLLVIPGQISCVDDMDCPTGQTCNLDNSLCRPR
jgi:hypothetical protein